MEHEPKNALDEITAIAASARDPRRMVVKIGEGRAVGTVPSRVVRELDLVIGMPWTPSLAVRFADAVEFDVWLQKGMRLTARRPLARAVLTQKLADKGATPAMLERVIARLRELGLVDDKALGQLIVEHELSNQPAGEALLRAKLERKGLEEAAIDHALNEASPVTTGAGAARAAMSLAKSKLASLRGVDKNTARRRLAGLLARRGFDEQVVQEVVERLLGVDEGGEW